MINRFTWLLFGVLVVATPAHAEFTAKNNPPLTLKPDTVLLCLPDKRSPTEKDPDVNVIIQLTFEKGHLYRTSIGHKNHERKTL